LINYLKKLFSLFDRQTKKKMVGLFFLMLIGAILEMLSIGLFLPFIQLITSPEQLIDLPIIGKLLSDQMAQNSTRTILFGAGLILLIFTIKNTSIALLIYIQNRFVYLRLAIFSEELLQHYVEQNYAFHLQRNSADFVRNIMNSVNLLFNAGVLSFLNLVMEALLVLGAVVAVTIIDPTAILITGLLLTITMGSWYLAFRHRMLAWGEQIQHQLGSMILGINQSIGSLKETKVLGRTSYFIEFFGKYSKESAITRIKSVTADQMPRLIGEIVVLASAVLVIMLIVLRDKPVVEALPLLGVFAAAAMRVLPSANRILLNASRMRQSVAALNTIFDDRALKTENFGGDAPNNADITFNNEISIQNLNFTYENSTRASLDDINLTISKGENIGIVGRSGAGKSTLVDITLGLLTPTSGKILVDGTDIYQNLRSWQNKLGYVPQEIYLCDDTLRKNIALGLREDQIDDDLINRALKLAHLDQVVEELPEGLNTMVGERGVRLSGGQRQRIGIARALYHEPDILVFDEATALLDNQTEKGISETVKQLKKQKTIILIAHRLSTVQDCDRIYLVDNGKIIDNGTFESLEKNSSIFRKIANLQETQKKIS
jgi:ATP-binding cassette, subfamily B, bacterial PglK